MTIKKIFTISFLILIFCTFQHSQSQETILTNNLNKDEIHSKNSLTENEAVNTNLTTIKLYKSALDEDKVSQNPKKYKELTGELISSMVFSLIGGLGIFLLGMRYMSDGLQTVAGDSLRKLIKVATDNRFKACGVGILTTLLVQSSSVTTVMAVGLVNSTVMELSQAIGIILGANIGTTITGWVLYLKIGKWGLPILGIAAFVYLFSKKEKVRYISMALMGIGMIFFGLEIMKSGFKPMKEIQTFEAAFMHFDASTYPGVLKCAFVGCFLTVIVQSSSATLGITIALAVTGSINFQTAAALVLGENIGTTITAYLATIGSSNNAKRAAYFHIFFNLTGVIWITLIFHPYLDFISFVMENFMNVQNINAVEMIDGKENFVNITGAIAMVHTIFNVANVILFLPLTHYASKVLHKLIPDN